jgi:hypothetical protein
MPSVQTTSKPWRTLAVRGALTAVLVGGGPGGDQPGSSTRQPATSSARPGWGDAIYRVTCDGLVQGGLGATLVNGAARVPT